MIRKILPLIISGALILTGCSKTKEEKIEKEENKKLTYSNLIDDKTQNEIKDILIESKIDKAQSQYFIDIVNKYNNKSSLNKLETSANGFKSINTLQVPYDEGYLGEIWDFKKLNYMDFNCRLTAFTLFKDFIKSEGKPNTEDKTLMFDIDAIKNNPISKFTKEDTDKFENLYGAIPVKNSKDVKAHSEAIIKEWKKRNISFIDNPDVSMINVFLHIPEDSNAFVGHVGLLVKDKDEFLFIEKYGASLPYQVSKFKNKDDVKTYLMDRLDVNTSDNGASKPIIMENDKLM